MAPEESVSGRTGSEPADTKANRPRAAMVTPERRGPSQAPAPLTRLIGRDAEIAALLDLIRQPSIRLVTVTGPGGVGKTHLAMEVAHRLASQGFNVVCIPLASVQSPGLVLSTIAKAIGAAGTGNDSPQEALLVRLADSPTILMLDNLEHLLPAATKLAELLAACPSLKILATSRSTLRLRGEHLFPVAPLPVPDITSSLDLESISANPAVTLFVERARGANPHFVLDNDSARIVAAICHQLDGLPLAIELAAARSRVLEPAALHKRLDRRLSVLTGGPRDLPDRLRTLRTTVRWSYDLLDHQSQRLFRFLSVFAGGADLRAAQVVAGVDEVAALDYVQALIDSSLLSRISGRGEEPRFVMLETIREAGLELLEERGELLEAQERHAAYALSLAHAAHQHLTSGTRSLWLSRLEQDHHNLRAALSFFAEQGDGVRLLELTGYLWRFWWWRSYLGEGRNWLERALTLASALGLPRNSVTYGLALTGAAALAETQGDYAVAEERYGEAVAIWQALNDLKNWATTLTFRWLLAFNAEDHSRMTEFASESLRLSQELDDPWGMAMALMELGLGAMRRRESRSAEQALTDARELFEQVGDQWGVSMCLGALANVSLDQQDYDHAARLLQTSLEGLLHHGDRLWIATLLPAAARMAAERRDLERAVKLSAAAVAVHETVGAPLKPPFRGLFERNLERARQALGEERFNTAWMAGNALSLVEAVALAVAQEGRTPELPLRRLLSARELEVLRLVQQHATDREIADALFVSYRTVTTHIAHILTKLNVDSRYRAVEEAGRLGLL